MLNDFVLKGIPTVKRAVMQVMDKKNSANQTEYELVVEGTNLRSIMTTRGNSFVRSFISGYFAHRLFLYFHVLLAPFAWD